MGVRVIQSVYRNSLVWTITAIVIPFTSIAEMYSDNYTITTTVISGCGSGPMTSASYQINGTFGQSSPLIDPTLPPQSTNYDLLTGFWYTIGSTPPFSACPADFEPDGDVDNDDLALLATGFGNPVLEWMLTKVETWTEVTYMKWRWTSVGLIVWIRISSAW